MVKNIIFGLVSWYDHYARCKAYTLVNSQKKNFWSWATSPPTIAPQSVYKKYILCIFWSCQNFKMKLPNFIFFHFLKLLCLLSNIHFEARETTNTKKVMPTVQIFPFFGLIWAKLTKNAIFWHKNGQKYHFRAGFMITTTTPDAKHIH